MFNSAALDFLASAVLHSAVVAFFLSLWCLTLSSGLIVARLLPTAVKEMLIFLVPLTVSLRFPYWRALPNSVVEPFTCIAWVLGHLGGATVAGYALSTVSDSAVVCEPFLAAVKHSPVDVVIGGFAGGFALSLLPRLHPIIDRWGAPLAPLANVTAIIFASVVLASTGNHIAALDKGQIVVLVGVCDRATNVSACFSIFPFLYLWTTAANLAAVAAVNLLDQRLCKINDRSGQKDSGGSLV